MTRKTPTSADPEAIVQPDPSLDELREHPGVADPAVGGPTETYTVGYRRPPKNSQFKPGQSGNPKGRSKQSRNLRTVVKQVLNESMQIREGGRLRRMSAIEALVRTTLARSFKDPKALHALMIIVKQSGYGNDATELATDLPLDPERDASIIADYLSRRTSANTSSADADPATAPSISPPEESDGGET